MADLDVEFDFENDLNTDVGQPAEAPSSMPASARKNYRQVSCKPERKLLAQLRRLALLFPTASLPCGYVWSPRCSSQCRQAIDKFRCLVYSVNSSSLQMVAADLRAMAVDMVVVVG